MSRAGAGAGNGRVAPDTFSPPAPSRRSSDALYRTLTGWQMAVAAVIGGMRQGFALANDLQPTQGQSAAMSAADHILGARGEMLIALDLDVFWDGTVGRLGGSDVGRLQVRTRSEEWHELPVYKGADPRATYILVVGTGPRFRIVGSIKAFNAKRREWLKNPGGRPGGEAYFVPQAVLAPYDRDALRRIATGL